MDNKILLATFYNGVTSDLFVHKLYDQEPQTMAELIHSAQSFMNAEDAIIVKKKKKAEWAKASYVRHSGQGPCPKKAKIGEKRDRGSRKTGSSSGLFQLHSLEYSTWPSVNANQRRLVLEMTKKDERRSQQTE